jgi:hypothetical protein
MEARQGALRSQLAMTSRLADNSKTVGVQWTATLSAVKTHLSHTSPG